MPLRKNSQNVGGVYISSLDALIAAQITTYNLARLAASLVTDDRRTFDRRRLIAIDLVK